LKKAYLKFEHYYVHRFLRPQFEYLGKGFTFMKPWNVEIFGSPIVLGDYANVLATPDKRVRLTVWSVREDTVGIHIGSYCLICPGVRISSALEIIIGDNSMIASGAYITDSDWHDIYNRVAPMGKTAPIRIEDNVWVGDSAIICKGVTIGENSIIGAGAVVVESVPPNTIAAGNPAKIVKHLDPTQRITKRAQWFSDPERLSQQIDQLDRDMLRGNTVFNWIKSIVSPAKED
jgi:acetyltransferase-like isoleucine patch superfamily enzyme